MNCEHDCLSIEGRPPTYTIHRHALSCGSAV